MVNPPVDDWDPRVLSPRYFSDKERGQLMQWGPLLSKLATGEVQPMTSRQRAFVEEMAGRIPVESKSGTLWQRYRQAKSCGFGCSYEEETPMLPGLQLRQTRQPLIQREQVTQSSLNVESEAYERLMRDYENDPDVYG